MNEIDLLTAEAQRFTLFAALRTIERNDPKGRRVGASRQLRDDPVRIAQPPYLSFAPTEVAGIERGPFEPRLSQYVFGFLGPNGPLPIHITELAYSRLHQSADPTLPDFLNALQHRVATLFYRAWADAEPTISAESSACDRFAEQIHALFGQACAGEDGNPRPVSARYAGLLAIQNKPVAALKALLEDTFDVPFEVVEFAGEWLQIPDDSRLRLGAAPELNTLGLSSTIGAESWQRATAFELIAGPLTLSDFQRFLPGSSSLATLRKLVGAFTHRQWNWRIRLLLKPGQASPARLGGGQRLGLTAWLGNRMGTADDLVINGDPLTTDAGMRGDST